MKTTYTSKPALGSMVAIVPYGGAQLRQLAGFSAGMGIVTGILMAWMAFSVAFDWRFLLLGVVVCIGAVVVLVRSVQEKSWYLAVYKWGIELQNQKGLREFRYDEVVSVGFKLVKGVRHGTVVSYSYIFRFMLLKNPDQSIKWWTVSEEPIDAFDVLLERIAKHTEIEPYD